MHSDFSLLDSNSTNLHSPTVTQITPAPGAVSSAHMGGFCKQTLTDEDREMAICKASDLVELFHAEARCMDALWRQTSDFTHKAAFDLAYSNEHRAREIRDPLLRSRGR